MTRIVCVHGIGQAYEAAETLLATWAPALAGGVSNAGGRLDPAEVSMAFYGALFRPEGGKGADGIPEYAPGDLEDTLERALLADLYAAHAPDMTDGAATKGLGARTLAGMLQVVAALPFFGGVAQKVVIWHLKQVARYVREPAIRRAARQAVLDTIRPDTRILVGHSLGSIVAWETLCAHPGLPVRTLLTLGSPLGVPALLPRLDPPVRQPPGAWPGGVTRWVNIADARDVVALEKRLGRVFGDRVEDIPVQNGATMHDVKPYLTSRQAGEVLA
ncbi:MAG: hypothetical protein KA180_07530 [Gemmatimonadales bacterium]|nr:hypothetical protein [Gemmatimonadales bacterium]